jgi:hypothetical protein
MNFKFDVSLNDVVVPGAEIKVGRVDISVSMEMEDAVYAGLVEMMYEQLSSVFGMTSIKPDDEEPVLNGSSPFP